MTEIELFDDYTLSHDALAEGLTRVPEAILSPCSWTLGAALGLPSVRLKKTYLRPVSPPCTQVSSLILGQLYPNAPLSPPARVARTRCFSLSGCASLFLPVDFSGRLQRQTYPPTARLVVVVLRVPFAPGYLLPFEILLTAFMRHYIFISRLFVTRMSFRASFSPSLLCVLETVAIY